MKKARGGARELQVEAADGRVRELTQKAGLAMRDVPQAAVKGMREARPNSSKEGIDVRDELLKFHAKW